MTDPLPSRIKLDPARIESCKRLEQTHPADRFKAMFGLTFNPPPPPMTEQENELTAKAEKVKLALCHLAKAVLTLNSETAADYGASAWKAEMSLGRDALLLKRMLIYLDQCEATMEEDEWCLDLLAELEPHKEANSTPANLPASQPTCDHPGPDK